MTELEKARSGKYNEIDLNRLAEEIDERGGEAVRRIHAAFASKDVTKAVGLMLDPAVDTLHAINAFLTRCGLRPMLTPQIAAALMHQTDVILKAVNGEECARSIARSYADLLGEISTTYAIQVPDERAE